MAYDSLYNQYPSVATTDATPTTLATLPLPISGTTAIVEACYGMRSGNNCAQTKKRAIIRNVSGTLTVASLSTLDALAGDAGLLTASGTIIVSGTNIIIQGTGIAATNITWSPCIAFRIF